MKRTAIAALAGILLLCLLVFPAAVSAEPGHPGTAGSNYYDDEYDWMTNYSDLYINSNPDNCSVYIDGRYQGKSPLSLSLENGRHSVSLAKSGYNEWSQSVRLSGSSVTIYPVLEKKVTEGYLSINSNPSGADVYINSAYRGSTPLTLYMTTGMYDVIIKKSGYKPYSSTVSVKDGKTSSLSATLQSDITYGYVTIYTQPSGAAVYVDGGYYGTTPANGAPLTLGPYTSETSHTVMVTCDGYISQNQSFSVSSGQAKTLNFNLGKDPSQQKASIAVSSSPAGAYIYIDNLFYGVTPVSIPNVETGSHVLKLTAAGYNDWQETISVSAGQNIQKSVAMSPAAAPKPVKTPVPIAGIVAGLLGAGVLFLTRRA